MLSQAAARRTLVLVVEGLATFTVQAQGPSLVRAASCKGGLQGEQQQCPAFKNGASGTLHSGSCFDMGLLNVLGEPLSAVPLQPPGWLAPMCACHCRELAG